MTRALTIGLVALSLLLLGGAWFASRALTTDVTAPPVQLPQQTKLIPVLPANMPAANFPTAPAQPRPVDPITALPPVPPPPQPPLPEVPRPTMGDPDSDYMDPNAPQIEEAWKLTNGPDANANTWRNAQRTFRRCLTQVPDNVRCQQGLAVVDHLLASTTEPAPEKPARRDAYRSRRHGDNQIPEESE